jgi:Flp pilus assembly protein TadG
MSFKYRARSSMNAPREGAITVLLAILLVVLIGCTALCIDIGYAALTKSALQNAADSAAAAGASALQQGYATYATPSQSNPAGVTSSAESTAVTWSTNFASYNRATDVASLKLASKDVSFSAVTQSGAASTNSTGYPNTISVTVRRDGTANPVLAMFFAQAIGTPSLTQTATASATIYTGNISSFNPNGGGQGSTFSSVNANGSSPGSYGGWGSSYGSSGSGFACKLLPVAFDVNDWNDFMASGVSPDGTIHLGPTNTPQIQIYPTPKNSPGNFGLLCIGQWTNSTPDYENWILNGPSANDLKYLISIGDFPVCMSDPKQWKASPGLRTVLASYFTQIIGQPRLLPVFVPASETPYQAAIGSGQNTTYAICGFVGVTVCSVSGSGSNLSICVKPCSVIDPTAVFDPSTVYPAGTQPASQLTSYTHPPLRITN